MAPALSWPWRLCPFGLRLELDLCHFHFLFPFLCVVCARVAADRHVSSTLRCRLCLCCLRCLCEGLGLGKHRLCLLVLRRLQVPFARRHDVCYRTSCLRFRLALSHLAFCPLCLLRPGSGNLHLVLLLCHVGRDLFPDASYDLQPPFLGHYPLRSGYAVCRFASDAPWHWLTAAAVADLMTVHP